jgi:hypothetical protein
MASFYEFRYERITPMSHQLPSTMVAREFGEVNVDRAADGPTSVALTILMAPSGSDAEGWQTGVALDGSASMKNWFGRELLGKIPATEEAEYERKGWIKRIVEDGRSVRRVQREAYEDAIAKGHLRMSANVVESIAREFIAYLARELDADGGTTVIYWACGNDGSAVEVIGDYTAEQCATLNLTGPKNVPFGNGTRLLPAVKYFVDRFKDAAQAMYVFCTDGALDDLAEVKAYTMQLARDIAGKHRNPVKCVLVGIGDKVDEGQMEELDDLDTGTEVDIWDHKIAVEMRSVVEIFAEVVRENQIVAPTAILYDQQGNILKRYSDGLAAKISFSLPAGNEWFELEVEGQRIRQSVVLPKAATR